MKQLVGLLALCAVAATALRRLQPGTYVLGDAGLAGELGAEDKPTAVAAKKTRVCSEKDLSSGKIPIWGTRTQIIWGSCTRHCCDRVERRMCDAEGNCWDVVRYENCADENCGGYVGFRVD